MEKELAQLYNKIASHLDSMIPVEWDKIYLMGEVEKGQKSIGSTFYFIEGETSKIICWDDIPKIYNVSEEICGDLQKELTQMIYELSNCFKNNEQELWEIVIFILDNNGKLNIDFKYDTTDEKVVGPLNREVIWAYNTFEYVPPEGTYSRKLLDKYLSEN